MRRTLRAVGSIFASRALQPGRYFPDVSSRPQTEHTCLIAYMPIQPDDKLGPWHPGALRGNQAGGPAINTRRSGSMVPVRQETASSCRRWWENPAIGLVEFRRYN